MSTADFDLALVLNVRKHSFAPACELNAVGIVVLVQNKAVVVVGALQVLLMQSLKFRIRLLHETIHVDAQVYVLHHIVVISFLFVFDNLFRRWYKVSKRRQRCRKSTIVDLLSPKCDANPIKLVLYWRSFRC